MGWVFVNGKPGFIRGGPVFDPRCCCVCAAACYTNWFIWNQEGTGESGYSDDDVAEFNAFMAGAFDLVWPGDWQLTASLTGLLYDAGNLAQIGGAFIMESCDEIPEYESGNGPFEQLQDYVNDNSGGVLGSDLLPFTFGSNPYLSICPPGERLPVDVPNAHNALEFEMSDLFGEYETFSGGGSATARKECPCF